MWMINMYFVYHFWFQRDLKYVLNPLSHVMQPIFKMFSVPAIYFSPDSLWCSFLIYHLFACNIYEAVPGNFLSWNGSVNRYKETSNYLRDAQSSLSHLESKSYKFTYIFFIRVWRSEQCYVKRSGAGWQTKCKWRCQS